MYLHIILHCLSCLSCECSYNSAMTFREAKNRDTTAFCRSFDILYEIEHYCRRSSTRATRAINIDRRALERIYTVQGPTIS